MDNVIPTYLKIVGFGLTVSYFILGFIAFYIFAFIGIVLGTYFIERKKVRN